MNCSWGLGYTLIKKIMEIKFKDITDQQCADIIAHFVKRKGVDEIVIHTKEYDIEITKKPKKDDVIADDGSACVCGLIALI